MNTLKVSVLALAITGAGLFACGSDSGNHDGGGAGGTVIPGMGGAGGAGGAAPYDSGMDQSMSQPDIAVDLVTAMDGQPDTAPAPDGGTSPTSPCFDCTGLTADQCHAKLITWTGCALDPSIVTQDPGPDPTVPYPTCSAM